jgi:hypothetical protein
LGNQPSICCKFKFLIAIFGKAESQNIGANN